MTWTKKIEEIIKKKPRNCYNTIFVPNSALHLVINNLQKYTESEPEIEKFLQFFPNGDLWNVFQMGKISQNYEYSYTTLHLLICIFHLSISNIFCSPKSKFFLILLDRQRSFMTKKLFFFLQ